MIKFVYSPVAMLLLVLASLPAFAESVTLSWDPPTERVNGDALDPVTEIANYDLRCALQDTAEWTATVVVPGLSADGQFSAPLADVFPEFGRYDCEMAAVDTFGIYSDYTIVQNGPVEWLPGKPKGPTNLLILFGG